MRTPLRAIRGYLQTLLDEPLDPASSRRFLEIARNETLRLGRMVDGMFAVSLLDLEYGTAPPAYPSEGRFRKMPSMLLWPHLRRAYASGAEMSGMRACPPAP